MTKASDNPYPSLLVVEGSTPTSPAAGDQRLFIDSADHKLKRVNSSGSVTTVEGGGGGSLTVQDENANVSTSVTQIDFQGAGVTATSGTGEVIVTIPGVTFHGCRVESNASQSVANNTTTTLLFGNEVIDTDNYHSTVTNTSRITIPSGLAGKYLVVAKLIMAANGSGVWRQLRIDKNGSNQSIMLGLPNASIDTYVTESGIYDLAVGDYMEISTFQDSGGSLNALTGSFLQVTYLGA